MSTKYRQARDGQWIRPCRRGYRIMCCDCGLVHRVDFKVVCRNGRTYLAFRATRDRKATAATRRARGHDPKTGRRPRRIRRK
jgi:hypothetical protein